MQVHFVVDGIPHAKARHRSYIGRSGGIRTYTPTETVSWENYVRLCAAPHAPEHFIEGPVKLISIFYMPIPKSWSVKKKEMAKLQKIFPTTKPDLDNMVKLVKDALNGLIWKDDKQVICSKEAKFYSPRPRTEVMVEAIEKKIPIAFYPGA